MAGNSILLEAESFRNPGGWVVDQQFMDEMGSPFLLAHGLGEPVADAVTQVRFPATGSYRVWVRTRDWVGQWKRPGTPPAQRAEGSPGVFQVLIDGRPLDALFGADGAAWHWQDGGVVEVKKGETTLALHDLTGFDGRCDALLFCDDPALAPPEPFPEWRRRMLGFPETPEAGGEYDLVVAGGGIAGICAAVSAAREGLRVALVQDRPVLGGNNSSETRVWLGGETRLEPFPRIGKLVAELEPARHAHYGPENTGDLYEDDKRIVLCRAEKTIDLFLGWRVNGVEKDGSRIRSVTAQEIATSRRIRLAGRWFADCTGDAGVGFLAGADFEITRRQHMGPTNVWNVIDAGKPSPFPRCPWALRLDDKPFPGRGEHTGQFSTPGVLSLGGWFWESGFDRDPIAEGERIRDWNFRALYGAWDALKNVDKVYGTYRLNWAAYIAAKRESRRLLGDWVLTRDEILEKRVFPDACFPCTWSVDLHVPEKKFEAGFEGDAFISISLHDRYTTPFWAPFRCLYSRTVANLFMGGRDISVTHEALGAVRVMRTGGMMGEAIGLAAALCRRTNEDPRGIYERHLPEFRALLERGVG